MSFWSNIFRGKIQNIEFDEQKKSDSDKSLSYREKCNKCGKYFTVEYELCGNNEGGGLMQINCHKCGKKTAILLPQGRKYKNIVFPSDKKKRDAENKTKVKSTPGYTFSKDGSIISVIFTKSGDSGMQFYFFEDMEIAVNLLASFTGDIKIHGLPPAVPALKGASIVKCTLEEIQLLAKKYDASVEACSFMGDSIVTRRY